MKKALMVLCVGMLNSGCHNFNGSVQIKNSSSKEIWVDSIHGFKGNISCGILSASGGAAHAYMSSMPMPESATLLWSYEMDKADHVSVVSLKDCPRPKGDQELKFEFTKDKRWEASVVELLLPPQ